MSEKQLTESAWKTFAKGKGYKDDALLKALGAFARAEKGGPEDRLAALEPVLAESVKLGKANAKDKDLAGYVADIGKAAGREKAAAQKDLADAKAKKAKEEQAAKAAEADAADSPALLSTKLLAFLRSVRGKDDVRLNALVAIAGKQAAAVVDRSSIGGSHRSLLQKHLGVSGIKFIKGELLWEAKAFTFALESGAGGPLAAKLKLGLFGQTGQKLKIRVRAADSDEVEETEDEPEADEAEQAEAAASAPRPPAAAPDKVRFERATAAVKAAAAAGHPNADRAKALLVRAMQALRGDPAGADEALKQVDKLLAQGGATASPAAAPATASTSSDATAPAAAEVERLLAQLTPVMDGLARPGQPLAPDLAELAAQAQRAFAMAGELAEQGNHERALTILKRIAEGGLLARIEAARAAAAAAPAAARGKPTLVEQRQFMVTRWKRIPIDLRAEVDALRKAIADDEADDDPQELAQAVSDYLDELLERLQGRLDDVVNTGDASLLKGVRAEVDADPLMAHLARNPVLDGSRFRKAVVAAIDEIEARIAG